MTTPLLSAAYVDTTALLPVTYGEEPVAESIRLKLEGFRYLLSANLLEAEMRAAFAMEGREFDDDVLSSVRWIMPNRPWTLKWRQFCEPHNCNRFGCGILPLRYSLSNWYPAWFL